MAGARKRPKYISVYVSEEEWKTIESLAKSVGLSQSAYLKLLGLDTSLHPFMTVKRLKPWPKSMPTKADWAA